VLIPPQVASSTTRADLSILQASDVSFGYRSRYSQPRALAVRNVSLAVPRGSFTGLLGPNGCGKTTLLKLLSGVLHPDSGRVTLSGRALSEMSRRLVASRIASVPQETHPAFDYTCMEMVLMGRHPHLGPFQLEGPGDIAIARGALAATGTAHLADRPYMTVSGGEKQRVVIAAALAQEGDVLLLDEPTASLDLGFQLEVALLLRQLNGDRGVTMVLATHDLNLAASLCDTLVLMRDGCVLTQGATRDVLTPATVRLLYDVDADVDFHQRAGHLTVVPCGRLRHEES
jgi:cobalamin transport system ATP-binding protein